MHLWHMAQLAHEIFWHSTSFAPPFSHNTSYFILTDCVFLCLTLFSSPDLRLSFLEHHALNRTVILHTCERVRLRESECVCVGASASVQRNKQKRWGWRGMKGRVEHHRRSCFLNGTPRCPPPPTIRGPSPSHRSHRSWKPSGDLYSARFWHGMGGG